MSFGSVKRPSLPPSSLPPILEDQPTHLLSNAMLGQRAGLSRPHFAHADSRIFFPGEPAESSRRSRGPCPALWGEPGHTKGTRLLSAKPCEKYKTFSGLIRKTHSLPKTVEVLTSLGEMHQREGSKRRCWHFGTPTPFQCQIEPAGQGRDMRSGTQNGASASTSAVGSNARSASASRSEWRGSPLRFLADRSSFGLEFN